MSQNWQHSTVGKFFHLSSRAAELETWLKGAFL